MYNAWQLVQLWVTQNDIKLMKGAALRKHSLHTEYSNA